MQIWYELDQAGQVGLTVEEILDKVSPRVPAGYAWRRYNRQRQAQRTYAQQKPARGDRDLTLPQSPLADSPKERARSVQYVIRSSLSSMVQSGTALKRGDGHYAALRKPKAAFTDEQHDFDGSITRKEVALMEWLRLARPLIAYVTEQRARRPHDMPHIPVAFYAATQRLVEAHTRTP
jgi:hypothetical protein